MYAKSKEELNTICATADGRISEFIKHEKQSREPGKLESINDALTDAIQGALGVEITSAINEIIIEHGDFMKKQPDDLLLAKTKDIAVHMFGVMKDQIVTEFINRFSRDIVRITTDKVYIDTVNAANFASIKNEMRPYCVRLLQIIDRMKTKYIHDMREYTEYSEVLN